MLKKLKVAGPASTQGTNSEPPPELATAASAGTEHGRDEAFTEVGSIAKANLELKDDLDVFYDTVSQQPDFTLSKPAGSNTLYVSKTNSFKFKLGEPVDCTAANGVLSFSPRVFGRQAFTETTPTKGIITALRVGEAKTPNSFQLRYENSHSEAEVDEVVSQTQPTLGNGRTSSYIQLLW